MLVAKKIKTEKTKTYDRTKHTLTRYEQKQ